MNKKFHRFLRRRRPVTPLALAVLALTVAFLAVASVWAIQAVGDYLVFGPAVFGGGGETDETPTTTATGCCTSASMCVRIASTTRSTTIASAATTRQAPRSDHTPAPMHA